MQSGQPSRTAWGAAIHRAAHQILEHGRIFTDPLAIRILGKEPDEIVREAERRASGPLRIFIAIRTRFAEDALAAAVEQGAGQLVVLGAGLDTFAYRSPFGNGLPIFEVDHPATQSWKRTRLDEARIEVPCWLTFVPVDFARQSLAECLSAAGFDPGLQTFFTWLGVVPYLPEEAVTSTLAWIASLPGGAHVVFDYSDAPQTLPPEARIFHERLAARVQAAGEAFLTHFEARTLRTKLTALGFCEIEDLGSRQIASRWLANRSEPSRERGGHIVRASTICLREPQ